jgi:hypothetical protein
MLSPGAIAVTGHESATSQFQALRRGENFLVGHAELEREVAISAAEGAALR